MNIPILSVYDADGNQIPIPAIKGEPGADGLTTSVTVNSETIVQVDGNIDIGTVVRDVSDKASATELNSITELTKGQAWDTEAGTSPAYCQSVPQAAKAAAVNMIGGKSFVMNQLVQNGNFAASALWTGSNSTLSIANGKCTATATQAADNNYFGVRQANVGLSIPNGHKIFCTVEILASNTASEMYFQMQKDTTGWQYVTTSRVSCINTKLEQIINNNSGFALKDIALVLSGSSVGDMAEVSNFMCIDLTQMFGAGNEPATVDAAKELLHGNYYPYSTGELISADVTEIVSRKQDSTVLGTLTIPAALRSAYPLHSAGTVYDEYDLKRKVFIQRVGSIDLGSMFWGLGETAQYRVFYSISAGNRKPGLHNFTGAKYTPGTSSWVGNMVNGEVSGDANTAQINIKDDGIADAPSFKTANTGVILYYELAEPVEIDISSYIGSDDLLAAESGGTVTFAQESVHIPIPNETEMYVKGSETFLPKKYYAFGDSVCRGYHPDASKSPYAWPETFGKVMGITAVNKSVGGSGWVTTRWADNAIDTVQATDISDADLITLSWCINDASDNSVVIGNVGDTSQNTVMGMVNTVVEYIYNTVPNAQLMICGSTPQNGTRGTRQTDIDTKLKTFCGNKGIAFIDLSEDCPINSYNGASGGALTSDGTHFNDAGYKLLSQYMCGKLSALYGYKTPRFIN